MTMTKQVVLPENLHQALVELKQRIPKVAGMASQEFVAEVMQQMLTAMNELTFVKDVEFDTDTGILTLTRRDNSIVNVNLAARTLAENLGLTYDPVTKELIITQDGEPPVTIPVVDLIQAYTGSNGDNIQIVVRSGNVIDAILKDGTVTKEQLTPAVQATLAKADLALRATDIVGMTELEVSTMMANIFD